VGKPCVATANLNILELLHKKVISGENDSKYLLSSKKSYSKPLIYCSIHFLVLDLKLALSPDY